MSVEVRSVLFGSDAYKQMLELRNKELRIPLGMVLTESDKENDKAHLLFGLVKDGRLIGGVMALPVDEAIIQIRQMVIDSEFQGRGYGLHLLQVVEQMLLKGKERLSLILMAREVVVRFYERAGYERVDAPFVLIGIPHQKMQKTLLG